MQTASRVRLSATHARFPWWLWVLLIGGGVFGFLLLSAMHIGASPPGDIHISPTPEGDHHLPAPPPPSAMQGASLAQILGVGF